MITASIVLYNTNSSLIWDVINSYRPNEQRKLFLIDNSHKRTEEFSKLDHVEYMYNGKNIGYGAAHNIGMKRSILYKAEYHIVLNPDIRFEPYIIDKLIDYAEKNRDVVYILPKVLYPDGEIQYLCKLLPTPSDLIFRRFFPNIGIFRKMNDRYILKASGYDKIINPPCLSGCFMFMRVTTIEKNNIFFDDRFFMYCEDFDLIRRLHRVGKTVYYPMVSIIHDHAHESYKNVRMLVKHIESAFKYFNKYGWLIDKERKIENQRILKEIEDGKVK